MENHCSLRFQISLLIFVVVMTTDGIMQLSPSVLLCICIACIVNPLM